MYASIGIRMNVLAPRESFDRGEWVAVAGSVYILICVYVSIRACKRGDEYLMCRKKRGGDGDGGAETPKKCSKTNSPNTNTNIASHSDTTVCAVSRSLPFASLLLLRCAHPSVRLFVCSLLFVLRMSLNLDVMLCCCLPEKASTVENKAKSWFGLVWFCVVNACLLNLPNTLYNRCIQIRLWFRMTKSKTNARRWR